MEFVSRLKIKEKDSDIGMMLSNLIHANKYSVFVRLAIESFLETREGLRVYNAFIKVDRETKKPAQREVCSKQPSGQGTVVDVPKEPPVSVTPSRQNIERVPSTPRKRHAPLDAPDPEMQISKVGDLEKKVMGELFSTYGSKSTTPA